MPKDIDVVDEAVIDSPPLAVYKAILNEFAGVTHWWMPYLESKLRGDIPIDREGAIVARANAAQANINLITSAYHHLSHDLI